MAESEIEIIYKIGEKLGLQSKNLADFMRDE
jgi:hypothetical protein